MLNQTLRKTINLTKFLIESSSRRCLSQNASPLVVVENRENVRLIGINRPEKRNCINRDTALMLKEEFEKFDEDKDAYVAILHGIGGTFCAGYDLAELSSLGEAENVEELSALITRGPLGPTQMFTSKPIIASVDGYAVAGGLELALWCDMRVVETTAIMGVFCRRFGVPLIDGGTVRLQKLIGMSRAMDLILTGRGINGKEAFDFGLANRLAPIGTALGQSYNLAQSLVKFPQECLRADRKSTYYAAFSAKDYEDALINEFEIGKQVIFSESIPGASKFTRGIGRKGKFILDEPNNDVDVTV